MPLVQQSFRGPITPVLFRLSVLSAAPLLLFGAISTLTGCGGGSSSSRVSQPSSSAITRGVVRVSITWPERTRLIPITSESVKVTVARVSTTGAPIAPQILTRAAATTSTASFLDLEPGAYTVTATAYPKADGTGTAQATATVPATVISGENTTVGLVMETTIDHLQVTAVSPTLTVEETATLTVTPRDTTGQAVLTDLGRTEYKSSAPGVADVKVTEINPGEFAVVVRGLSVGQATITVTDSESGKTGTLTLTVKPKPAPQPKGYAITYIPTYTGWPFMFPMAINNKGEVAGYVSVGSPATAADRLFIWRQNPSGIGGQYTDLGPFVGYSTLYVKGINDKGEICGEASRSSVNRPETHAWVYKNGGFVDLGIPSPDAARPVNGARGINNAGQISGYRSSFLGSSEAFVWQDGQITYLDTAKAATANAISHSGLVAGWDGKGAGFRYDLSTGQYTPLLLATGYDRSTVMRIRDDGMVVGLIYQTNSAISRGCYWENGKSQPTILEPMTGATISAAWSVNSSGTIAGYSILPDRMVATRWVPGESVAQDLNTLVPALGTGSKTLQTTQDINDAGQIIGTSSTRSYVLTPLP